MGALQVVYAVYTDPPEFWQHEHHPPPPPSSLVCKAGSPTQLFRQAHHDPPQFILKGQPALSPPLPPSNCKSIIRKGPRDVFSYPAELGLVGVGCGGGGKDSTHTHIDQKGNFAICKDAAASPGSQPPFPPSSLAPPPPPPTTSQPRHRFEF